MVSTARIERPPSIELILPSLLAISSRMGTDCLPLRATFLPAHPLARQDVPLTQARATNPLHLSLRERPSLPFTARIERAHSYRARSASKKGSWSLPSHPSEAARCASTEDHQPPSPTLPVSSPHPVA